MPDSHPGNSPCKEIWTLRKLTNIYPQKYQQENKMPENNEKEPQYKSILSDDDGTAPRPIRKKQRDPMAEVRREIEEQQRQQQIKAAKRRNPRGRVAEVRKAHRRESRREFLLSLQVAAHRYNIHRSPAHIYDHTDRNPREKRPLCPCDINDWLQRHLRQDP